MGNVDTDVLGKPAHISDAEWRLRIELAAAYRVFDWYGWNETIFNHITVRVPGPERHFLINPFGLWYDEVTASNLVKVDLAGNPVAPSEYPINRAGFIIHSAVHAARDDAHCIMHTHTTTGMAIACRRQGLAHDDFYGAMLIGRVAYHDFEGITVHADEGPRLIANIGDKPAVILRNHGLLAWAESLPRAFAILWLLNRACEIQLASTAMGPVIEIPEAIQRKCTRDSLQFNPDFGAGQDVFDALTRAIDAIDPSYKT